LTGSYSINGWLYYWEVKNDGISTWIGASELPKFFQKDINIAHTALTPFFMDAIWPDTWPGAADMPPTDLYLGNVNSSLGRICLARHPLRNARVSTNQKLPSAICMSYADGHAGRMPLQNLKNLSGMLVISRLPIPGKPHLEPVR